jgi:gluconokinase
VIAIVFGVSGSGKTTLGKLLARQLGWHFIEADDFHPAANIEKMHSGHPLTDEDRWPWLDRLREQIKRSLAARKNAVLACSALKRAYRERLRVSGEVKFVFLRGDYAIIEAQLSQRRGHFMNPRLLRSQFADLEEPKADEDVLTIELGRTPQELVEEIKTKLHLASKQ